MKVSFVIPSFNQGAFIRRTLDSCLAQNLPDAEILVRDGLSTDGTVEILREYGEKISWVSQEDRGQADAVNQGIQAASGEVIAWINSDDFYADTNVLSTVLDAFEADPQLDIVYGNGELIDEQGNYARDFPGQPIGKLKEVLLWPTSFVLQPALFFKRSLFLEVGGLNLDYHLALDYELWIRMFAAANKTRHIPQVFARATMHSDAKSIKQMSNQIRETLEVKRKHQHRFDLNWRDHLTIRWGDLRNRIYHRLLAWGLYRPYEASPRQENVSGNSQ